MSAVATMLVHACGDCAGYMIQRGAELVPGEIELGTTCDVHPTSLSAMAIRRLRGGEAPPKRSPNAPHEVSLATPAPPLPTTMGPLTEIAARFIVAWTAEDKGAGGDELVVAHAVGLARQLLAATGGA